MKTSFRFFLLTASAVVSVAEEVVVDVNPVSRGNISQQDGSVELYEYYINPITGFRNFFIFDFSELDGFNVTSAQLRLVLGAEDSAGYGLTVFRSIEGDLNLSGNPTFTYSDLGDGTIYSSLYHESILDAPSQYLLFDMNSDFISAATSKMGNGALGLGGSLESYGETPGLWTSGVYIFDSLYFNDEQVSQSFFATLSLTGSYGPIPEPSTYGLILGSLVLAGAALRRRRKV